MDYGQDNANLLDRHNRLVADILSHFRTLAMLATIQSNGEEKDVDPQSIAVTGMSMQMEFEGLNTSIKDLLALSRRLKELWLFGRLGAEDEQAKAQAEKVERDVVRCAELVNAMQEKQYGQLAEECGGKWEPMKMPAAVTASATTATTQPPVPGGTAAPTAGGIANAPGAGGSAAPTPNPAGTPGVGGTPVAGPP